jgi:ABC-type multidrug transport system ATPase subunit
MITLSKVSKWYPNFQVLKHCSTEVAKGEVVVVCGPSGSGKSTLIKCGLSESCPKIGDVPNRCLPVFSYVGWRKEQWRVEKLRADLIR